MTHEKDERSRLTGEDARFVERLASHYRPEPLDEARRSAFDARLRERLDARSPRWTLAPAVVAACATAVVAWVALPLWTGGRLSAPEPAPLVSSRIAPATWEQGLFYGDVALRMTGPEDAEELPPDYVAIESVLLDG